MTKFEYIYFACSGIDLQVELNKLGIEGWRLHTCEPYIGSDPDGLPVLVFNVVMDRAYQEPAPSNPGGDVIDRPEAIACKN